MIHRSLVCAALFSDDPEHMVGHERVQYCHYVIFSRILSIQEFWFLYMATESIPCRHQGTVLYKHIPLLDSSPLTNLNTFANGKISYGTAAKREVGIQSAHSKQHVELATGVASLEGARLFHLLCALFWECWPFSSSQLGLFTQHGKSLPSLSL